MIAIIPEIAYMLWCIFFAFLNSIVIERLNETVRHWFNGLMHLTVCVYFGLAIHYIVAFVILLIGRLFFDVPLNLFRGLPFDYVSANPKSFIDKVEKAVFGNNGYLPKIIYGLALVTLLVIQFKLLRK